MIILFKDINKIPGMSENNCIPTIYSVTQWKSQRHIMYEYHFPTAPDISQAYIEHGTDSKQGFTVNAYELYLCGKMLQAWPAKIRNHFKGGEKHVRDRRNPLEKPYNKSKNLKKGKKMKLLGNLSLRVPQENYSFQRTSKKPLATGNFAKAASAEHTSREIAEKSPVSKEEAPVQAKSMVMQFRTSDGKKGELYWSHDMLASTGGTGGTVNAKYHESSTEEDPVAVIWGTDSDGKQYKKTVHLNDIDPNRATPAEMIALNAHISKTSDKNAENPIALWASMDSGVNSKMDFEQYYREYIAMQEQGGNPSGANLYQLQLERFLFFYQQNKG